MVEIYKVNASSADGVELFLYGDIGDWCGATAKDLIDKLRACGSKQIKLRINSVGGDVFEAQALYSYLKTCGASVEVWIDGLAASAASIVAMAGNVVKMPVNALLMVHNPSSSGAGSATDLRKTADVLDKIRASLISVYVAKTGKTADEIGKLLDAETWMTAAEAKANGFVDEVVGALDIAASVKQLAPNRESLNLDKDAVKAAVMAERERLRALDELNSAGCEAIILHAKYVEPRDARDIALDLYKRKLSLDKLADLKKDAADVLPALEPSLEQRRREFVAAQQDAIAREINAMNTKAGV